MENTKPKPYTPPPGSREDKGKVTSVIERVQKIVQKSRDRVRQSRATQKSAEELIAARPRKPRD
jgi:hypothetical protein